MAENSLEIHTVCVRIKERFCPLTAQGGHIGGERDNYENKSSIFKTYDEGVLWQASPLCSPGAAALLTAPALHRLSFCQFRYDTGADKDTDRYRVTNSVTDSIAVADTDTHSDHQPCAIPAAGHTGRHVAKRTAYPGGLAFV